MNSRHATCNLSGVSFSGIQDAVAALLPQADAAISSAQAGGSAPGGEAEIEQTCNFCDVLADAAAPNPSNAQNGPDGSTPVSYVRAADASGNPNAATVLSAATSTKQASVGADREKYGAAPVTAPAGQPEAHVDRRPERKEGPGSPAPSHRTDAHPSRSKSQDTTTLRATGSGVEKSAAPSEPDAGWSAAASLAYAAAALGLAPQAAAAPTASTLSDAGQSSIPPSVRTIRSDVPNDILLSGHVPCVGPAKALVKAAGSLSAPAQGPAANGQIPGEQPAFMLESVGSDGRTLSDIDRGTLRLGSSVTASGAAAPGFLGVPDEPVAHSTDIPSGKRSVDESKVKRITAESHPSSWAKAGMVAVQTDAATGAVDVPVPEDPASDVVASSLQTNIRATAQIQSAALPSGREVSLRATPDGEGEGESVAPVQPQASSAAPASRPSVGSSQQKAVGRKLGISGADHAHNIAPQAGTVMSNPDPHLSPSAALNPVLGGKTGEVAGTFHKGEARPVETAVFTVPANAGSTSVDDPIAQNSKASGDTRVEVGIQDPSLGEIRVQAQMDATTGTMRIDVAGHAEGTQAVLDQITPLLHAAVVQQVESHAARAVHIAPSVTFSAGLGGAAPVTGSGAAAIAQGSSLQSSLSSFSQQFQQQRRPYTEARMSSPAGDGEEAMASLAPTLSAHPVSGAGLSVRI